MDQLRNTKPKDMWMKGKDRILSQCDKGGGGDQPWKSTSTTLIPIINISRQIAKQNEVENESSCFVIQNGNDSALFTQ